jgi:NAD(P)H-hydrate repair Nnr-like enzyme with NAD(P)H-hydrate dehydratase domain
VALNAALYGRAAPWLATAGAGDVLSGLAAGLMARGFAPAEAGGAAAWLHVAAARRVGPGLVAEDLPEALPAVLAALER